MAITVRPEQVKTVVGLLRMMGNKISDRDEQVVAEALDTIIEQQFDGGGRHRKSDPDPAKWAARAQRGTQKVEALIAFFSADDEGLIGDELWESCDPEFKRGRDSWHPRINDLVKMGFVEHTSKTRSGFTGFQQGVYKINLEGRAVIRQRGWA